MMRFCVFCESLPLTLPHLSLISPITFTGYFEAILSDLMRQDALFRGEIWICHALYVTLPPKDRRMMEATTVRKVVEVTETPIRATNGRPLIRRVEKILMPNGRYRYPVTYIDMTPGYVDTTEFWKSQKRVPGYEIKVMP